MASASASLALPELNFLSSKSTSNRRFYISKINIARPSLCRRHQKWSLGGQRAKIQAVKEDNAVFEGKRDDELMKKLKDLDYNGNGNGSASRRIDDVNSSINGYSNGSANGSLMKYVNGTGIAVDVEVVGTVKEGELNALNDAKKKEDARKKKVEEIGKEEAWFKKKGQEKQIEV